MRLDPVRRLKFLSLFPSGRDLILVRLRKELIVSEHDEFTPYPTTGNDVH